MRYRRRQAERWPEREKARRLTRAAILGGRLIPEPCERCRDPQAQAHHDDYSKPLVVRWLCRDCHAEHHGHAVGRAPKRAAAPPATVAA
jgi:hypothetical protein